MLSLAGWSVKVLHPAGLVGAWKVTTRVVPRRSAVTVQSYAKYVGHAPEPEVAVAVARVVALVVELAVGVAPASPRTTTSLDSLAPGEQAVSTVRAAAARTAVTVLPRVDPLVRDVVMVSASESRGSAPARAPSVFTHGRRPRAGFHGVRWLAGPALDQVNRRRDAGMICPPWLPGGTLLVVNPAGRVSVSYPANPHVRVGKRIWLRPTVTGVGQITEFRMWKGKLPRGLHLNRATGAVTGRIAHAGPTHTITIVATTKAGALLTAPAMRLRLQG